MTDSFPRQQARTRRFSLGVPRSARVSPDGSRVAFLRSKGGDDPVTCLWVLDTGTGEEHLVADPAVLDAGHEPSEQEKARRERVREQAGGIVAFATDQAMAVATFELSGRVYLADLANVGDGTSPPGRRARALPSRAPAFDPRLDPTGRAVAYVCAGALRLTEVGTGEDRQLAGPDGVGDLTFGLAEFVAAEEMGRTRGYWWAPDGAALLVARVDTAPVDRWQIADPARPDHPAAPIAYPAAGTANADVSLMLVRLDGGRVPVEWDRARFPYLVTVDWDRGGPLIVVQSRDQRRMLLLSADPARAATAVLREDGDEHWVDIVPGVPARTSHGRIVWAVNSGGARRLLVAAPEALAEDVAEPVTPATMQVRAVLDVDGDVVLFTASQSEPAEISVWRHGPDGLHQVSAGPGVHTGRRSGGVTVVTSQSLAGDGVTVRVLREDTAARTTADVAGITSLAQRPDLPAPAPDLFAAGPREIRTALLLPSWHRVGSARLPVLLDPYGGPRVQRVLASRQAFLTSQWFAEQGFAVVVADGRGTGGRGPAWDRAIAGDLAGPVVADQEAALAAAAARCADLDLGRVAIRGWSFGGYLAAIAVLRRPRVFHAAIAGAPVTDWRLYDTHYTERYLGRPEENPDAYDACSAVIDAERLAHATGETGGPPAGPGVIHRPLMLIHGLADDNVVAAHTLRLSASLLAAGYPHCVLPLPGVTHMTPQEAVAENLLLFQLDFLRRSLGTAQPTAGRDVV